VNNPGGECVVFLKAQ